MLLLLLVLQMAALGLGFGIIVSSLTPSTATSPSSSASGCSSGSLDVCHPHRLPLSMIPEQWRWLVAFNPMSLVIEIFKYTFLGRGVVNLHYWISSNRRDPCRAADRHHVV